MCGPGYTQPREERSLSITNFISFFPLRKQHAGSSWVHSRNAPFLCTTCPGKWSISPWFLARLKHRCVSVSPLFSSALFLPSWVFTWEDTCLSSLVLTLLLLSRSGPSCPRARRALHLFAFAAVITTTCGMKHQKSLILPAGHQNPTWVSLS